jgi:hypothetical protein
LEIKIWLRLKFTKVVGRLFDSWDQLPRNHGSPWKRLQQSAVLRPRRCLSRGRHRCLHSRFGRLNGDRSQLTIDAALSGGADALILFLRKPRAFEKIGMASEPLQSRTRENNDCLAPESGCYSS